MIKTRTCAHVLTSLASLKDASLAPVFQAHLDDPSYATIRAAAFGLGASKSPVAYEALTKLLDTPSWRDTIKAASSSLWLRSEINARLRRAFVMPRVEINLLSVRRRWPWLALPAKMIRAPSLNLRNIHEGS
jgi:hypothetical protein